MPVQIKAQETALEVGGNFSYFLIVEDKNIKDGKVDESKDVKINDGNALFPTTRNIGTIEGIDDGIALSDQISVYVIGKGDSIEQIAKRFDVSVNTILWANDMKKGDKLVEGDTLVILPIDGVNHIVANGDTLKKIADKYNVDVSDIAWYNDIMIDAQLTIGQELVIPGAEIETPVIAKSKTSSKNTEYYSNESSKNVSGFIYPLPSGPRIRKTQGLHDHGRAIDIGAPINTPIYASASGTVIYSANKMRGYGNAVIIQHSGGVQTLYAHMIRTATHVGEKVSQGEVIGYVGSTGHSTGPHLHFEVRGAKNPF